jgi:hypothetical protein
MFDRAGFDLDSWSEDHVNRSQSGLEWSWFEVQGLICLKSLESPEKLIWL